MNAPAKVSATTGPADSLATSGCSPIGSIKSVLRFVPILHGSNDFFTRYISPIPGFTYDRTQFYRKFAFLALKRDEFSLTTWDSLIQDAGWNRGRGTTVLSRSPISCQRRRPSKSGSRADAARDVGWPVRDPGARCGILAFRDAPASIDWQMTRRTPIVTAERLPLTSTSLPMREAAELEISSGTHYLSRRWRLGSTTRWGGYFRHPRTARPARHS